MPQLSEQARIELLTIIEALEPGDLYGIGHIIAQKVVEKCTKDDTVVREVRRHLAAACEAYDVGFEIQLRRMREGRGS